MAMHLHPCNGEEETWISGASLPAPPNTRTPTTLPFFPLHCYTSGRPLPTFSWDLQFRPPSSLLAVEGAKNHAIDSLTPRPLEASLCEPVFPTFISRYAMFVAQG